MRSRINKEIRTHKVAIRKATAIQIFAYFMAAFIYSMVCIALQASIGWILMNWLFGFIIGAPVIIRQENIIKHHHKIIERLYDELDEIEEVSHSDNIIRVNFGKIAK